MFEKLSQMGQFASMMKNLQSMRGNMEKMKEELASAVYHAKSSDNLVEAAVSGEFVVLDISIAQSLLAPEYADVLRSSVIEAVNNAVNSAKADAAQKLSAAAGGMDLSAFQ